VERVQGIVRKYGKQMIGWEEIRKAAFASEGIKDSLLKYHRSRIGITTKREGFPAKSVWVLPDDLRIPADTAGS
jgi:hypothetical protein